MFSSSCPCKDAAAWRLSIVFVFIFWVKPIIQGGFFCTFVTVMGGSGWGRSGDEREQRQVMKRARVLCAVLHHVSTLQPGWMVAAGGRSGVHLFKALQTALSDLGWAQRSRKKNTIFLCLLPGAGPRRQEPDEQRGAASLLPEGEIQEAEQQDGAASPLPALHTVRRRWESTNWPCDTRPSHFLPAQ